MKGKLATACLVLLASVAACGGGDDEDEDDLGEEPEDTSGGGIWEGTFRIDGQSESGGAFVLATEEGEFVLVAAGHRIIFGSATASGDSFSGTGSSYLLGAPPGRQPATIAGTVAADGSLSGSYSVPGESGTFNLAPQDFLYESGASLARLAGVYSIPPNPQGFTVTASINSDGVFTINFSTAEGCMLNGTVQVVHPEFNYYRWSGTQSSCNAPTDGPVGGVMYLGDMPPGRDNYVRIFVQTQSQTAGGWLGLVK